MMETDLNKIIMSGEPEITDASYCQICIHLDADRLIYIEPKNLIPGTTYPAANCIISKASRNELTHQDMDYFRAEEICFTNIPDHVKNEVLLAYGIGKPEDYTPEFYKQLIIEGVFELGYIKSSIL